MQQHLGNYFLVLSFASSFNYKVSLLLVSGRIMIFRVKRVSFTHEVKITCTNGVIIRQILRKKRNDPIFHKGGATS